jgi:hypothetical protein
MTTSSTRLASGAFRSRNGVWPSESSGRLNLHFGSLVNPAIGNLSEALVVASSDAVRDDIVKSLRAVGMGVVSTQHVDDCIAQIPAGPSLVVLHPDGFGFAQVVGILFALRRERPDVHAVLVTDTPDRYMKLIAYAADAPRPSVVPLPARGGTIGEDSPATDPQRRMQNLERKLSALSSLDGVESK